MTAAPLAESGCSCRKSYTKSFQSPRPPRDNLCFIASPQPGHHLQHLNRISWCWRQEDREHPPSFSRNQPCAFPTQPRPMRRQESTNYGAQALSNKRQITVDLELRYPALLGKTPDPKDGNRTSFKDTAILPWCLAPAADPNQHKSEEAFHRLLAAIRPFHSPMSATSYSLM